MSKEIKTNAMRLLDSKKAVYTMHEYEPDVAMRQENLFKTLVTVGKSKEHYVFVVPIERELDLKKAAKAVGEKNIEMIKERELLPLTGYVHGGCSPLGMKKFFKTTFDKSAEERPYIMFSGGRIGKQIETTLDELRKVIEFAVEDVSK